MARSNKLNVSNGPAVQRMSSKERQAARVAEVANKQRELKQEAAQRRAAREADAAGMLRRDNPVGGRA
ncbi:MAG: hypothetical protein ACJ780_18805 [Solirubrobacteraceae bacterium]